MRLFSIAIIICLALSFFISISESQPLESSFQNPELNTLAKIKAQQDKFWENIPVEKRKGWKQYKRWAYLWERRIKENEPFPDYLIIDKEIESHIKAIKTQNRIQASHWTPVGPFGNPESGKRDYGVGRINIVRFHPNNEAVIWAGSASGGVWFSTNGGANWNEVPFKDFLSLGVSDIALAPSQPNIIYVGTGDNDGASSIGPHIYAIGVVKSTDAGKTWKTTNLMNQLSDNVTIGRVIVHPFNPDIVLATTNKGIYKTTDGGMSWALKTSGIFYDMEHKPGDFKIIYSSSYNGRTATAIYRSTDEGESWNIVKDMPTVRRSALAVTPAEPDNVYAITVGANSHFENFLFSSNNGETWEVNSAKETTPHKIIGMGNMTRDDDREIAQGWYDLAIAASPKDADHIIIGGINLWESFDKGKTWSILTDWYYGSKPKIHADQHDIVWSKSGSWLAAAHDGGLDISSNKGSSWTNCNNGLSITQFYRLSVYQGLDTNFVLAGSQDNGTSRIIGNQWQNVFTSDGMECIIDPQNKARFIVSTYNGFFYKTTNGGATFNGFVNPYKTNQEGAWVTPLVMDQNNKNIFYAGYNDLWRTTDDGLTWKNLTSTGSQTSFIYSIALSPSNANYVYYSTGSNVFKTSDSGKTFKSILSPDQVITYLASHPLDPEKLYVALGGYNKSSKVLLYDNGKVFNLSGNLPNVPVNAVIYQDGSSDRIYAATDIGVYYSDHNNGYWIKLGDDLPNVFVHDIEIKKDENMLYAATYGRGIWKTPLINCNTPLVEINVNGELEFCQGDSVILKAPATGGEVVWSDGRKGGSITVSQSGSYSFAINPESACPVKSDLVVVNVKPTLDLSISGYSGSILCEGDTITLSARIGFKTYKWSTGETTRKIIVTKSGEYFCNGILNNDCPVISEKFKLEFFQKPQKPELIVQDGRIEAKDSAKSYQWYKNGLLIEGTVERELKLDGDGNYQLQISNDNGCKAISDKLLITSLNESSETGILIYPNPNNGRFTLEIPPMMGAKLNISVFNLLGNKVYDFSKNIQNGSLLEEFNLSNLPKSIYNIKIKIDDTVIYKQISLTY